MTAVASITGIGLILFDISFMSQQQSQSGWWKT